MAIWFQTTEGESYDITIKPMLQVGLTAYNFEPFKRQTFDLNLSSYNLFNPAANQIGKAWNNGDNTARAINIMRVKPNTKYTITINNFSGIEELWWFGREREWDSTKSEGNNQITTTNTTFTTKQNTNFLGIQINKTSITQKDINNLHIQVVEGGEELPYEEFWENELCKIGDHTDYIYNEGAKWYKHNEIKKVTLNGSETWTLNGYNVDYYEYQRWGLSPVAPSSYINTISDSFSNSTSNRCLTYGQSIIIRIPASYNITTAAGFTTWLTSHNVRVYYQLAVPYESEITDSKALNYLNNIKALAQSYYGTTNITITTNNAQPTLKVQTLDKIGG